MAESSPIKISEDISEQELSAVSLPTKAISLPASMLSTTAQSATSSAPPVNSDDTFQELTEEGGQEENEEQDTQGKFVPVIKEEEGYKTVTGSVVETVQESKFLEALQSYFKIKTKYESSYKKKKNKIMGNNNISIHEKRERIQKIKTNCILCKKSVGTIFSNKNKHYKAICGSSDSPCKLNIDLIAGNVVNIEETLELISKIYEEEVISIMKTKLDLLFNFKNEEETLKEFAELNDSLKSNNKILKYYRDLENNLKNNVDNQENMERINNSVEVLIDEFKQNIEKYQREKKLSVLKDSMMLYTTKIMPLLQEKQKGENIYQAMEFDGSDETYHLVQRKYLPNKLEDVVQPSSIVTNNS